jgi:hypothetical protein
LKAPTRHDTSASDFPFCLFQPSLSFLPSYHVTTSPTRRRDRSILSRETRVDFQQKVLTHLAKRISEQVSVHYSIHGPSVFTQHPAYSTCSIHKVTVSHGLSQNALSLLSWHRMPLPSFLPLQSVPSLVNMSRDNRIFTLSPSIPFCRTSSLRTRTHRL